MYTLKDCRPFNHWLFPLSATQKGSKIYNISMCYCRFSVDAYSPVLCYCKLQYIIVYVNQESLQMHYWRSLSTNLLHFVFIVCLKWISWMHFSIWSRVQSYKERRGRNIISQHAILKTTELAYGDTVVECCQGWIWHNREFFAHCRLVRNNIGCDVDKVIWQIWAFNNTITLCMINMFI